jgi:hypothetical protein
MKIILAASSYTFTPATNQVNFTPMGVTFDPKNLLAILNVTTGKTIFATGSADAGLGGSFAGNILTYASSNAGQNASDILQVFYDDPAALQQVAGTVSVTQPVVVEGAVGAAVAVASAIHDGSGTFPILSTPDPISGRDGLDINLQSSSFAGKLNNPLPLPYQDQALSVGYINGGDLVAPAMNISNELVVDATQSGNLPVAIQSAPTLDVNIASSGISVPITSGSPLEVEPVDLLVTGFGPQTTAGNNVLEQLSTANSTSTLGYKSGTVQIVSASTTGTYIFEQSADNINFVPLAVFNAASASPNAIVTAVTATASTIVYHFPIKARYIRCRIATVLNNTGIRAFTRLSSSSWDATAVNIINATAANLNSTVSGTVTVTQPTPANLNTTALVAGASLQATTLTDIASAAITTTQTSANITTGNQASMSFQVGVSATSGTGQFMDVVVQESFDGTNFFDIYHFPRITAVGQYQSPQMRITGAGIRYVRTVGGTSPSFTNSVLRPVRQTGSDIYKNFLNRTIDPNTLGSTTAAYNAEGCDEFQLVANMAAGGTAPVFKMQGSEDNANWFDMPGLTLTATVGAVSQIMTNGTAMPKFIRGIVGTAGVGSSLVCLHLKARGV